MMVHGSLLYRSVQHCAKAIHSVSGSMFMLKCIEVYLVEDVQGIPRWH